MLCPVHVKLSDDELMLAHGVAERRQSNAVMNNYRENIEDFADEHPLTAHIHGAQGELVFCKATGIRWTQSIFSFKNADVGVDVQIRCSPCKAKYPPDGFGNLVINQKDNPQHKYVLVAGNAPYFVVRGWILGEDAMHQRWLTRVRSNPAIWLVPSRHLNPDLGSLMAEAS